MANNAVVARAMGLRTMGRAFANRNYQLFFAGQGVSLVGTWMVVLAIAGRRGSRPNSGAKPL